MSSTELTAALTRYANSDLRTARKHGEIIVAGTKRGNVTLSYNDETRTYLLTALNMKTLESDVLAKGKAANARNALIALYVVEGC